MAWDLRAALLRKGEVESARLDDFAFRERARTMKLLAEALRGLVGDTLNAADLIGLIVERDDEAIVAHLAELFPEVAGNWWNEAFARCRMEARRQLIAEIGDPTPHRLA